MWRLHIVRLAALWVLAGATLKLLHGNPKDLPGLLQDVLPLGLDTLFKLVISVEFVVGLFALLHPRRGWKPLLVLLLFFLALLTWQVMQGATACGCFGGAIDISPAVMLGIDATLIGLLILARPWATPNPRVDHAPQWAVLVFAALLGSAALLPWLYDRSSSVPTSAGSYVLLDARRTWPGKRFDDPVFDKWMPEAAKIDNGVVLIWSAHCEMCADLMLELRDTMNGMDGRELRLLELPNDRPGETPKVHDKPEGHHVRGFQLPGVGPQSYSVTPPVYVEVLDGVILIVKEGADNAN